MFRALLDRTTEFVTTHTRITLVVMLVATVVILAGIPQIDTASQAGGSSEAFDDLDRVQASQYVFENYGSTQSEEQRNRTLSTVYVYDEDRNLLSKSALLEELRFQQELLEDERVQRSLHPDGVVGISNLVALQAADSQNADLERQIAALEATSESEVEQLVAATLANDPRSKRFLPADHDPDQLSTTDRRLLVVLDLTVPVDTREEATAAIHESATQRPGYFTLGTHTLDAFRSQFFTNLVQFVLPLAFAIILFVLAFSYRDLVDIVVGMSGVVLSVLWMFGLLGWLGVGAGIVSIVPVVLITGLSIDFGFHVFNRYREQRDEDDPIRPSMQRGLSLVATALILVTITAAIGFLSNLANPLQVIRDLGVSITLGVVSALVIFTTVVPALKIGIDGLLEWAGLDRRKQPLGRGRYLGPLLSRSVTLAQRAAPVVVVVAVIVGLLGGLAWTALEEESFQQSDADVAEWKQQLPGPMGWDTHPYRENNQRVEEVYQPASTQDAIRSRILIRGDVTGDDTLEAIHSGTTELSEAGIVLDQSGTQPVQSPVTIMQAVAAQNEAFAAEFQAADTDDNGVPDQNLAALYDALYETNPEVAGRVVERTDDGYQSLLVEVALDADFTDTDEIVGTLEDSAATIDDDGSERSVTLVGILAVNDAVLDELTSGILLTMVIALLAIVLTLVVVFRFAHGSASLGALVAIPIAMVIGLVIGGMFLLDIPLTLLTALLMSLVIGLGVDYNIHIGDRFADELRAGESPLGALDAAVVGTGGALVGSTLTSAGAFTTLTLVPDAQLQSFGIIVVLALVTSFLASVLVLPSILLLWVRYGDPTAVVPAVTPAETAESESA